MSTSDNNPSKQPSSVSDEDRKQPRKKRAPPGEFDRQVEIVRKEMQAIKDTLEATERRLEEAERLRNLSSSSKEEEEKPATSKHSSRDLQSKQ
eukprot:jgi/Galph1/2530/GphlegSOOS_G1202.1